MAFYGCECGFVSAGNGKEVISGQFESWKCVVG